jgi:hypothetical protein
MVLLKKLEYNYFLKPTLKELAAQRGGGKG